MTTGRQAGNQQKTASTLLRLIGLTAVIVLVYTFWADLVPQVPFLSSAHRTTSEDKWGILGPNRLSDTLSGHWDSRKVRLIDASWLIPPSWISPWHLDAPKPRLIAPGPAPNKTLFAIQREIEKGNLSETASRLRQLAPSHRGKAGAEKFLVAMWNNLGVKQNELLGPDIAVDAFRRAGALDPANPVVNLSLAHAYWQLQSPALTQEFLEKVIRLNPGESFPHVVMAELLRGKGDEEAAARHLTAATGRTAADPALWAYAERLTAKVHHSAWSAEQTRPSVAPKRSLKQRERVVEAEHKKGEVIQTRAIPRSTPERLVPNKMIGSPVAGAPERGQSHFVVKFVGNEDREIWERVRAILEYAYQDIGRNFGQYPSATISVVLHPDEEFLELTGTPRWADMLFDSASGEIHLPVQGALSDLARLSRVVRHEFAHALLRNRIGSRIKEVPSWVVEGLAIQLAEDPWSDLEDVNRGDLVLMPLNTLEGPWSRLSKESLPIAYLEAQLATRTLIDRYTLSKVRQLLTSNEGGKSLHAVVRAQIPLTDDMLQKQWKKRLRVKKTSAGS